MHLRTFHFFSSYCSATLLGVAKKRLRPRSEAGQHIPPGLRLGSQFCGRCAHRRKIFVRTPGPGKLFLPMSALIFPTNHLARVESYFHLFPVSKRTCPIEWFVDLASKRKKEKRCCTLYYVFRRVTRPKRWCDGPGKTALVTKKNSWTPSAEKVVSFPRCHPCIRRGSSVQDHRGKG